MHKYTVCSVEKGKFVPRNFPYASGINKNWEASLNTSVTVNFKWYDRENPLHSVNVRWGLISRNQLFLDRACKRLFSLFIFLCIEDKYLHVSNDVLGMFMVIVCCLLYGSRPYQQQFVRWWNWVSNDKLNFEEQYGHWNSSGIYLLFSYRFAIRQKIVCCVKKAFFFYLICHLHHVWNRNERL